LGTTTVNADGTWTKSGLSLVSGDIIVAAASGTCVTASSDSNPITITTQTNVSSYTINITTPSEGQTSVSGTISGGSYPITIKAYVDQNYVGSGVVVNAAGAWTVSGLNAFDLAGEFNFFSYERKEYLPFSKTFTPFIFAGVGGALGNSVATMSLPFGVGFKAMLGDRLNLNIMWSNRLMFNDNLEGKADFNDHAELNGTNIFNNDMLSTLSVGITLNIWKKKCDCSSESF
jgi:hypothetical protein